ncbi:hypothetical protein AMECASPLE_011580, partial [Ameca splendens]
ISSSRRKLDHLEKNPTFAVLYEVTDQSYGASFFISAETVLDHSSANTFLSRTRLNGGFPARHPLSFPPLFLPLSSSPLSVNPWESSTRSGLFEEDEEKWQEVKKGFTEPCGPEPYQFELLAQGADSAKSEAGAAEAVEEQVQLLTHYGGVSE